MDIAERYAEHAVAHRFEDLPRQVIVATRQPIPDTLGAGFAGSTADAIEAGLMHLRDLRADAIESISVRLAHSARPVSSKQADALAESVENIEDVRRIDELALQFPFPDTECP